MAYNIADLFEHAVDAVPGRVALIVDDEPRTYAELEAGANRIAHHLQAQGVATTSASSAPTAASGPSR
jgi:3-oxocholest-4-en-26-oate---CoA ligase